MARTKKEIKEFVEQEQDQSLYEIARDEAEVLDPNTKDDFVSARVKGSWVMFWSHTSYSLLMGNAISFHVNCSTILKGQEISTTHFEV